MNLFNLIKQTLHDALEVVLSPRKEFKALYGVSLYRNAVYLILNFMAMGATGFFFWMMSARLYPAEAVGLASALIAAMGLIALLATLGLDFAIVRFLPGAGKDSKVMINTSFTICGLASIALPLIFIAGLDLWSPALLPIREHPIFITVFVASVAANVFNVLVRQAFIAKRKSSFALAIGLVFGFLRFIPLVIMANFFHAFGIFTSWGIALTIAMATAILLLIPRIEAGYRPSLVIRKELAGQMFRFSSANYIANLVWIAPSYILPMMVINFLEPEQNAYYYIGWAIANILFMIPIAVSFSLFAEGSYTQEIRRQDIARSLKLILLILLPAVLLIVLTADKILLLFGEVYSENSAQLLRLLSISALPLAINYVYFAIKRVEMQMRDVIGLSFLVAIATLGLSYVLLPRMGINGVGIAWLASQGTLGLIATQKLWRR